jgi:hypothetical protein
VVDCSPVVQGNCGENGVREGAYPLQGTPFHLEQESAKRAPRVQFVRPVKCLGDKLKFGPCKNK